MTEISLAEKFRQLIEMLCDLSETYWAMGNLHRALAVIDGHESLLESEDVAPVDKARLRLQQLKMMLQQAISAHTLDGQAARLHTELDEIETLSTGELLAEVQQLRANLVAAQERL
jgi:hypothetical protein